MSKRYQFCAAAFVLLGTLGLSAGASAVQPGQTPEQAASSTGSRAGDQPAVNQIGKTTDCTTAGTATMKSGEWKQGQGQQAAQSAADCPQPGGEKAQPGR